MRAKTKIKFNFDIALTECNAHAVDMGIYNELNETKRATRMFEYHERVKLN